MPSYLITGVSRGLGYELLRQYSSDPKNTVIGLVRNKQATDDKISRDADFQGRSNFHILEADMVDYGALKRAAADTANITGGSLDYVVGNAALMSLIDGFGPLGDLADRPKEVTNTLRELFDINVIGNVHLINLFLPLIVKGQAKKIVFISTGLADTALTNEYDIVTGGLYAASKAALNLIVAKYSAQYKKDGILIMALSPGVIDTGSVDNATEEQLAGFGDTLAKFMLYAPDFKGPTTADKAAEAVRSVIAGASIENGNGGEMVSHLGTKRWL